MMADISLTGVLVVAAIAFAVPLLLGLAPTLHLPSVVLEIVAGIVIGPRHPGAGRGGSAVGGAGLARSRVSAVLGGTRDRPRNSQGWAGTCTHFV